MRAQTFAPHPTSMLSQDGCQPCPHSQVRLTSVPPVLLAWADGVGDVDGEGGVPCLDDVVVQAQVGVPPVATVLPGQVVCEGCKEVEENISNNHIVVDGHQGDDEDRAHANTWRKERIKEE